MKVALLQCPVWGTYDPPIALAQLSSCLKKEGHEVFVFDLNIKFYKARTENYKHLWAWELSQFWCSEESADKFFADNKAILEEYVKRIVDGGVKVAAFSVNSASRLSSLKFAGMIKEAACDTTVIFGGPLFFENKFVKEILNTGLVDIVIPGEGEFTLIEVVNLVERKKDIASCKGIYFKNNKEIIFTEARKPITNLDVLPFLDFSDLPLSDYDDSRHFSFMASRGCIQKCVFCSSRAFWPGYRAMSGERLFKEIEFQLKNLNKINPDLGHIDFLDLVFNGNMDSLVNFCDLVIKSGLKIFWTANMIVRPEMNVELIKKMRDSGCEHIIFGIESGSQRVLDLMRKNYRIEDADRIIRWMHEAGITVTCNFMFGFPGEAEDDFQKTLDFIKRNSNFLDRVYPSRTYCGIEEHSYMQGHLQEFNIKPHTGSNLFWESFDRTNTFPERLRRCREFSQVASSLGIKVGNGVQTSVELDELFNLSRYYEEKKDFEKSVDYILKYFEQDPKNVIIANKIKYYSEQIETNNNDIKINGELRNKLLSLNSPKDSRIQRRFTWNIHYDCNFRCPYCFFEGKWAEYKKRNIYLTTDEWIRHWKKIYDKYGRSYILITGGEPFAYPDFISLIEQLSDIHYPINISTNTSGDLKTFVKRIDPGRVSVSVSFQPYFERLEIFLEKVKFLRDHNFNGCINLVAYPPFIKNIRHYVEKFKAAAEELKIIPFWGKYQGKDYPLAYSQSDKQIICIDDSWFNKVRKKGSLCPAGYNSALIFPEGKIARCGQIGEESLIGNLFDNQFKLLDKPAVCEAEYCPCDENELFGEKEDKISVVNYSKPPSNNKLTDEQKIDNSLLNDEEYNLRKTVLRSCPKSIFIQAAGPCNSNCVFCSRPDEYELFDLKAHRRRFENNLYPFISRAETLVFTGSGEFLRLPDANEILDFFDNNFPQVEKFFSTNGTSLVPWVCEKVMGSMSRYTIHISLHASNPALHRALTRTDNFHNILEQVKYLVKRRKDKTRPAINLIFVATTMNITDLPDFVRLVANLGIDKVICYYNYVYRDTQKYLSCFFKQDLTNRVLDEAQYAADKLKIKIELPPKFRQKEYPKLNGCREPFSQIMLDFHGRALPCDASEDCNEILKEGQDFMEIWNSQYYQNLRDSLFKGDCSCFKHCFRANPASVNDFKSHVITRGMSELIDLNPQVDSSQWIIKK